MSTRCASLIHNPAMSTDKKTKGKGKDKGKDGKGKDKGKGKDRQGKGGGGAKDRSCQRTWKLILGNTVRKCYTFQFPKVCLKLWSFNIEEQLGTSNKCFGETLDNMLGFECHFVISSKSKLQFLSDVLKVGKVGKCQDQLDFLGLLTNTRFRIFKKFERR